MSSAKDLRKQKTIKIFIVLFIIVDILVSSVYLSQKYKICKEDVVNTELNNCEVIANDNLEDMIIALETLSACFAKTQWNEEQSIQMMKALQEQHGFDYVVKIQADGNAVNMDGKNDIYLGDREYFLAGMQGETTTNFISQGKVDSTNSFILSAVPIVKDNVVIGIVHGSYSVKHYFDNIAGSTRTEDELVMLVDANGNIIASLNDKEKEKNLASYGISESKIAKIEDSIHKKESGSFRYNVNGIRYIASYTPTEFYKSELSFVVARRADKVTIETDYLLKLIWQFLLINGVFWIIWIVFVVYIINRRNAEKETRRLNTMISNIPIGIMVYRVDDDDISIIECSSISLKMMGISREKTLKTKNEELLSLVHENDKENVRKIMRELSVGNQTKSYEYRIYNKNLKEYVWIRGNAHSVARRDKTIYIYITQTDITEEKQTEQLKLELEVTKAANSAKMQFLSTMSHDLRTPLNTVINMTTLAYDDINDEEKIRDDLAKIEIAGNFMLGLIKDVLDVSRIESGKMKLSPQPYHFVEFQNYMNGIIVPLCENKDIKFISQNYIKNQTVLVDPIRFNQVFFNILSNAVKYSEEGTEILFLIEEIKKTQEINTIRFTIKDQGIGMSDEFMRKLFQPFERENTSDAFTGTGLGMYISKQIVELMNGTIEVKSKKDVGTKVVIVLPLIVAKEEIKKREKTEENLQQLGFGKILIVEDHPLNREIVVRLLEKKGYTTAVAENGLQALNAIKDAKDEEYQAIIMDIRMPVMDGLTATREIRALLGEYAKHVPIIAMSANAFDEDKKKSLDAGMDAHLAKPVVPDELYKILLMHK